MKKIKQSSITKTQLLYIVYIGDEDSIVYDISILLIDIGDGDD